MATKKGLRTPTLYRNKEVIEEKIEEGYSLMASGKGTTEDQEPVAMWVFYHPDGHITTNEFKKSLTPDMHTVRLQREAEYTPAQFALLQERLSLTLSPKSKLEAILEGLEG